MAHKHPGQRPTRLLTFFFGHGFATELADRNASVDFRTLRLGYAA
jgi:hypothetical protein